MSENEILLEVQNLKMWFPVTQGIVIQRHVGDIKAVDGLNFFIRRGETLGLVGESGCGKSTTGRAVLQLYRPTGGDVYFEGQNLTTLKGEPLRRMRRKMQMIFQDPYASLNPRMTVGDIVGEPLEVHNILKGKALRERVMELLEVVGLNRYFINRYHTSFRAGSASASAWRVLWRCSRTLLCVMSPSLPLTFPFRRRSSTCSKSCRASSI